MYSKYRMKGSKFSTYSMYSMLEYTLYITVSSDTLGMLALSTTRKADLFDHVAVVPRRLAAVRDGSFHGREGSSVRVVSSPLAPPLA